MKHNKRQWVEYNDLDYSSEDFEKIGAEYEKQYPNNKAKVGYASTIMLPSQKLIDFGKLWMEQHR